MRPITIVTVLYFVFLFFCALSNDETHLLIKAGKIKEANAILSEKYKNNSLSFDEFLQFFYLQEYMGIEHLLTDFSHWVKKSNNSYAYTYALFKTPAVIGGYGIKNKYQLQFINELINDKSCPDFIKAAALYHLSYHYFFTHDFKRMRDAHEKINSIEDWYYTGPFYNISGSGMDKVFEPELFPQKNKIFETEYFGKVYWHHSPYKMREGWVAMAHILPQGFNKLFYAQTFIYSPQSQNVVLEIGFGGCLKVFLNDYPVFVEYKERGTDFGAAFVKVRLNKGYNRLLVKIGTENNPEAFFCIRLLNEDLSINKSCQIDKEYHEYTKNNPDAITIPSPVETFLKTQIEKSRDNVYNYITLARYYARMEYFDEAADYIEKAFQIEPENPIVLINKLYVYAKAGNDLKISETYHLLKEKQPESLHALQVELTKLKNRKDNEEALKIWNKIAELYPNSIDAEDYGNKIILYARLEKMKELVDLINEAYDKFPDDPDIVKYKAYIEKEIFKNPKSAMKIYEKFLSNNFHYSVFIKLMEEYQNQKQIEKAEKLIKEYLNVVHSEDFFIEAFNFYYVQQKYDIALQIARQFLTAYPFNSNSWTAVGNIYKQLQQRDSAIVCFKKAIEYNHNNYEVMALLREIQGKKSLFNFDAHLSIDQLNIDQFNNQNLSGDYTILYDHNTLLMYSEGGRESIRTLVIKILNQKGIEQFKETSLSNSNVEEHTFLDIFLMKPDKKKVFPNIYENNHIIWPSIDIGDVLFIKYRTRYYYHGKMSKNLNEFMVFGDNLPSYNYICTYIVPENIHINIEKIKFNEKVVKIDSSTIPGEPYKIYRFKSDTVFYYTNEYYSPSRGELSPAINLTTFKDWGEIAQWYYDITFSKFDENDITTEKVFKEIFPDGYSHLNVLERAEKIYKYVIKNISYLSNPLAQNNLIPQKASKTIQNKLGDCKDLSVLFVTLAQKAGVKSHLLLVRSRNKYQTPILQPTFNFDHCMVKFYDENNQEYILELTQKNNPFLCLPSESYKVWALNIPSKSVRYDTYHPFIINPSTRKQERLHANYNFEINNLQLLAHINIKLFGNYASSFYADFDGKTNEEIKNYFYKKLSDKIEKNFEITNLQLFKDSSDVVHIKLQLKVNNFVKKIGNQKIIQIPYYYNFITQDVLSTENRQFDFVYEEYEPLDWITDTIIVNLSSKEKFSEIPRNVSLRFNETKYSLTFKKSKDNQLITTRHIRVNRKNFPASQYPEFRDFGNKIIESEGEYIRFNL